MGEWTLTAGDWRQYSVDLRVYAGQSGYIAVRHFNCTDKYYIKVDHFVLDTAAHIEIEMPVTITPATVFVRMKDNLSAGAYSGTLTASAGSDTNVNGSVSLSGEVIAKYNVTLTANPVAGGTVEGAGTYVDGTNVTIVATANTDYNFVNWTEGNTVVSTDAEYTFTVTADRNLVANFEPNSYELEIAAYNNDGDGWYLIASPLDKAVDATDVTNLTNETFDLYRLNQSAVNMEWENWKQESDHYHFQIEPGKGYLYANSNDVTLSFIGLPTTKTEVSLDLDYDSDALADVRGHNLVGNPFAQTATIDKDFYRMNETHTDFEGTQAGEEIGIMEGIIVVADGSDQTVTFSTATRGAKSNAPAQSITLTLAGANGKTIDRAVVRFNKDSQLPKYMLNSDNPNIYIPKDNGKYAIAKADSQLGETPVNFKTGKNGSYTLYVNTQNIETSYLHLIDNLTGADIDLLQTSSYTFNGNVSDYASRFRLVYNANGGENSTFGFVSNGEIVLTGVDGYATVQVIDALGRIVVSRSSDANRISTSGLSAGVYVLRVVNGSDAKTQKIVIE